MDDTKAVGPDHASPASSFSLNEEQTAIRDMARSFADEQLAPKAI